MPLVLHVGISHYCKCILYIVREKTLTRDNPVLIILSFYGCISIVCFLCLLMLTKHQLSLLSLSLTTN